MFWKGPLFSLEVCHLTSKKHLSGPHSWSRNRFLWLLFWFTSKKNSLSVPSLFLTNWSSQFFFLAWASHLELDYDSRVQLNFCLIGFDVLVRTLFWLGAPVRNLFWLNSLVRFFILIIRYNQHFVLTCTLHLEFHYDCRLWIKFNYCQCVCTYLQIFIKFINVQHKDESLRL